MAYWLMLSTGLVGMIVTAAMGIVVPTMYMSCSAVGNGISSPSNFDSKCCGYVELAIELGLSNNLTSILREALPGGNRSLVKGMGTDGIAFQEHFGNVVGATQAASSIANYSFVEVNSASSSIDSLTTSFISAAFNDLEQDPKSMEWFTRIAARTLIPSCLADPTFTTDSLVPSTDLNSLTKIPCATGTSPIACADFATCATGCIDMYSVMAASASLADFQAKFAARYAATPACVTDITAQFSTNYNNWYAPRVDPTNGIPSVKTRWDGGTKTNVNDVVTNLPSLAHNLSTILNNSGIAPLLADAATGIFAGLDTTAIGEDIELVKSAVCVKAFNSLYLSFVLVGISSFFLLPVICMFAMAKKDIPIIVLPPVDPSVSGSEDHSNLDDRQGNDGRVHP